LRLKPSVKLLLSVLLLIGAAVILWFAANHRKARERPLAGVPESRARLVEMLGSSRPFEGRLLGMSYASFDPARVRKPLPRGQLMNALAYAEDHGGTEAERLSNEALVQGFGGELDVAIQTLIRATGSKGAKPWMWSDLSAFYMERFRRDDNSQDLLKALDSSAQVQDSPSLPFEARFNYALSLEKLSLFNLAKAAWKDYAARERDSDWSAEAKAHLQRIEEADVTPRWERARAILESSGESELASKAAAVVHEFPQFSREFVEEDLLGRWGEDWLTGSYVKACRTLDMARQIGKALKLKNSDAMLENTVYVIDHARGRYKHQIALGHRLYHQGLLALDHYEFEKAHDLFVNSHQILVSSRSPFADWARLRIAVCAIQQFRYGAARAILSGMMVKGEGKHRALLGETLWSLALIYGIQGRPLEAVEFYQRARNVFDELNEDGNEAVLESLAATEFRYLGDSYSAWRNERAALDGLPAIRETRKRAVILDEAGVLLQKDGSLGAALAFQDEIIAEGSVANAPVLQISGLQEKALILSRRGERGLARKAIEDARRCINELSDKNARVSLLGDLLAIEGEITLSLNARSAVEFLTPALKIYSATEYVSQFVRLRLERARAYMRLGALEPAEQDLAAAIDAIKNKVYHNRGGILGEGFLEQARQVFEERVDLSIRLGRPREALEYAEEYHNGLAASRGLSNSVEDELDGSTLVVSYFIIGSTLHVWLIRRGSLDHYSVPVSRLDNLVDDVRNAALQGNLGPFKILSGSLAELLLGTLRARSGKDDLLVFVPDRSLNLVPFSALWDSTSRSYLVEKHPVTVSPSIYAYIQAASEKRAASVKKVSSVMAVGGPDPDRSLWPELESLDGARQEAEEVAKVYPGHKTILGSEATIANFIGATKGYDVIHFAGHAIVNYEQPLLSGLIFSPKSERDGSSEVLYARDLYRHDFTGTRLVVLASCTSLGGQLRAEGGLSSLARPFLLNGVPAVVGTLWPVKDRGAYAIMLSFHRQLRILGEPVVALRKVQVDAISASLPPGIWAAFQLLGT
jgi:CHAT domain-containing protein